eukprot:scaffold192_cov190-Pinguiococcus_pyrenoidosus.AAC.6
MMKPLWPRKVRVSLPDSTSQILAVLSFEPVTTKRLSGEIASDKTQSPWPCKVCISLPDSTSQILAVLSFEPVTTKRLSGEIATEYT